MDPATRVTSRAVRTFTYVHRIRVGRAHVALARLDAAGEVADLRVFERSQISAVHEAAGLSATALTLVGAPGDPPAGQMPFCDLGPPPDQAGFTFEESRGSRYTMIGASLPGHRIHGTLDAIGRMQHSKRRDTSNANA